MKTLSVEHTTKTAKTILFASMAALGVVASACGGSQEESAAGGSDLSQPTTVTPAAKPVPPRDSISCNVEGITFDAILQKAPNPCTAASAAGCRGEHLEISDVPVSPPQDGQFLIIDPNDNGAGKGPGSLVYEKTAIPNSNATHYLVMASSGFGQWGVLDVTIGGDEGATASGSLTVRVDAFAPDPNRPATDVVSKQFAGVSCTVTPNSR